jgi:hypothetical protein
MDINILRETLIKQECVLLQLMQKVLRFEIIRNRFVVAGDYFVNLLLPAGLHVTASPNCREKFSERDLNHGEIVVRNLEEEKKGSQHRDKPNW